MALEQTEMFDIPKEPTLVVGLPAPASPLSVEITVSLHRTPRQKCSNCGRRRICFYVGAGELQSPPLCGPCARIR
jgi:hypothetical protein